MFRNFFADLNLFEKSILVFSLKQIYHDMSAKKLFNVFALKCFTKVACKF